MKPIVKFSDGSRQWANELNDLRDRWKIKREVSTEKEWMPVVEFQKSIDGFHKGSLLKIKSELLEFLFKIKGRLGNEKYKIKQGIRSNPEWCAEAEIVRRAVSNHLEIVNHALGKIPKGITGRVARAKRIEASFIDIAKEELSPELFQRILDMAKARSESMISELTKHQ